MEVLQIIAAVLAIAPRVLQLIQDAEGIFGPKTGPQKKAYVVGELADQPAEVRYLVSPMIDSAVALAKGGAMPPAAPPAEIDSAVALAKGGAMPPAAPPAES